MNPTTGSVLVASAALQDPTFKGSVVYMLEHGSAGSLGFIVNQSLEMPLSDLWADAPERFKNARIAAVGGPVERHKGLLLHGHISLPEAQLMAPGVAAGGLLPALVKQYADGPDHTGPRLFLGHSGWVPGQLDREIEQGSWIVKPGRVEWLLDPLPKVHLWQHLLEGRVGLPDPSLN